MLICYDDRMLSQMGKMEIRVNWNGSHKKKKAFLGIKLH